MVRTSLYIVAGVLLGLAIHLVVILTLPALAEARVYDRIVAMVPLNQTILLDAQKPEIGAALKLDPGLAYAVCRLDLSQGPGEISGTLPAAFWSVAVYDKSGTVIYSTTNRDGIGQTLDMGVFDVAQTRLLAEQKIDVAAGLLIVEARTDDVFALVRLAPEQPVMLERYQAQLAKLNCRTLKS